MLANAALIIFASDIWSNYVLNRELATMSQRSQNTFRQLNTGKSAVPEDIAALGREMKSVQPRIEEESDRILYTLVAVAALVTFALGYLVVGRMGKGLTDIAGAARRIAGGDLTARARPISLASREEAQLTTDFNQMSTSLQRAERELAESTASIAHELRTPLTILRGRLHGIADGVFALEPGEIDGLLAQVEGLGRLVDDLQTLGLAHSHRMMLTIGATDLGHEAKRVLAAMQPDLEVAGLEPVTDLRPTPLEADSIRLRQAIGAVLANASRYAANSGPLRISTRREGSDSILEIVDHGPGLPDNAGDQPFDRFWRAEASRSRHTGGTGLGLAVVRAIVEAHGGFATLTNHDGGGAIFTMRLPRKPPVDTGSTIA